MTFTYAGDMSTDLEKVRFHIGDTVSSAGPRPSTVAASTNFTDEELGGVISTQGSWQKAVAAVFDALASAWAVFPDSKVGQRSESLSQVSDNYRKLAARWYDEYGASGDGLAGASSAIRQDGYGDDYEADEV
jgi:hypothetical protein